MANESSDILDEPLRGNGTFAAATELCGSMEQGLNDDYVKRLGRTLCTFLSRRSGSESGRKTILVAVSSESSSSSSLLQALIDGLLLGGAEVIDLGPLTLSQFELCQFAAKASAGVYLAKSKTKVKSAVSEGTFLDATQEEPLSDDSSDAENALGTAHGVSIFIEQVPQIGERLQSFESMMSTLSFVSGKASYRRASYEEWVPDAQAAENFRAQANSKTIVEKNGPT